MLGRVLFAAALALTAIPAAATTVTVSFEGTITAGFDYGDLFGLGSGADLTGQTVTTSFTYDTDAGDRDTFSDPDIGSSDELTGGAWYGLPTGAVQSTVTVNGVTIGIEGDFREYASVVNMNGVGALEYYVEDLPIRDPAFGGDSNLFVCQSDPSDIPDSLDEGFTLEGSDLTCEGKTTFKSYDSEIQDVYVSTWFTSTFTAPQLATVPIPAGFGFLAVSLFSLAIPRFMRKNRHDGEVSTPVPRPDLEPAGGGIAS